MSDLRPNSEIADGIHWIKDGYYNYYIVERPEDLMLVDTGMKKNPKSFYKYVRENLESKKLAKILLTHHHIDHTGGLRHFHDEFHPQTYIHEIDNQVISGQRLSPYPNLALIKPVWYIYRKFMHKPPVIGSELVSDGDKIDNFEVHHLPGHTMGSVGFKNEEIFFTGDAAVSGKNGTAEIGVKTFAENYKIAMNTFVKISKMNFDILIGGHGTPILENADQRVKEQVEALNLEEILMA